MKKCNSDALIPKEVPVIYYRLKTYVEYFPTVKKIELTRMATHSGQKTEEPFLWLLVYSLMPNLKLYSVRES